MPSVDELFVSARCQVCRHPVVPSADLRRGGGTRLATGSPLSGSNGDAKDRQEQAGDEIQGSHALNMGDFVAKNQRAPRCREAFSRREPLLCPEARVALAMDTNVQDVLHTLEEPLKDASAHTVYGDPIETQGKTIIPVAEVRYGFGAGGGNHPRRGNHAESHGTGGGGGGVAAPYGVLEVTPEGTKLIRFNDRRRMLAAMMIGALLGMIFAPRRKR